MPINVVRASKFLSLVLRHRPEIIGIVLDKSGWVEVGALLIGLSSHGLPMTIEELVQVVETNNKRRFAFNAARTHIRASQGHSVAVDLGYQMRTPPARLYHGTSENFLHAIRANGVLKGERQHVRQHVHLSVDHATAKQVGARRGRPVVLTIDAQAMHSDGLVFYLSENGVWLTEEVPPHYILNWGLNRE
jgi:putative RNA 2'-phosphotransferase